MVLILNITIPHQIIHFVRGCPLAISVGFVKSSDKVRQLLLCHHQLLLGGLGSAEWEDLPLLLCLVPIAFLLMLALSKSLNAMMMGDSSAITLGVNLNVVRNLLIVVTALLTASSVAVSGCIGFVGLVIPHMVRSVVGPDHRKLIPISTLTGAIFLIWVDVGARMIKPPAELPIGILTAFLGAPLFLWMIRVRRYEF